MFVRSSFVLGLVLATSHALAAEYGPSTFARGSGTPATIQQTFTRRVVTDGYRLEIANRGVSSADVWLNGQRVASERDFSQRVTTIRRTVALRDGANEVAVRLAGAPGGSLTITIAAVAGPNGATISTPSGAQLTIPPGALAAETPVNLTGVTASELAEAGIAMPEGCAFLGAVSLDLGGAELTSEGELSIPAPGAESGERLIVARALAMGDAARFVLADTASLEDGNVTTSSPPYTGVRTGGTFVAMQIPAGLAILGVDVRGPGGAAVRDAFVGAMVTATSAPPSLVGTVLAAQSSFLGLTDASGFAALPVLVPNSTTYVIASARGTTPSAPLAGSAVLTTGGGIGYPPSLADRISIVIGQKLAPDAPDEPPPPCACTNLGAVPGRIPLGTHVFKPGHAMQLNVFCGSDDVTQSSSFTLQTLVDSFATGVDVHWTIYQTLDSSVATVDAGGLVRAAGAGQTFIEIRTWRLTIGAHGGLPFPQICHAATTVPVRVDRTGACCDPGAGCSIRTESECSDLGGTYKGHDTACSPNPCPFGACCNPVTGCTELPQSLCSTLNGTFHGNGTSCTNVPGNAARIYQLVSGGGAGSAGFPIPFTHGTVKTTVTIPGNIINGQCVRDWRVEIMVCRHGGGCQGAHIHAGQHFSICHANPETITFEQLNPSTACSHYSVNALTAGVSQITVEVIPP